MDNLSITSTTRDCFERRGLVKTSVRGLFVLVCIGFLSITGCKPGGGDEIGSVPESVAVQIGLGVGSGDQSRTLPLNFLLDPQVTAYDYGAPSWKFDGQGGSLIPGSGWTPVSTDGGFFAFVERGRAELEFWRPTNDDLGMFFRARGIPSERGDLQQLSVILNGVTLPAVDLKSDLSDYRIKLPTEALQDGLNRMELRFAFATTLPETEDPRLLSAAFYAIAIVPSHIPAPFAFLSSSGFDQTSNVLSIADGAEVLIPIAPKRLFSMGFGEVQGAVEGLEVVIDVAATATQGTWGEIWRGKPEALSGQRITVDNSWNKMGKMRILVHSPDHGFAIKGAQVYFSLNPDALRDSPFNQEETSASQELTNVFVYLVDALRADKLGPFGGPADLSPNISGFAADSVVYLNAESASSWTLPAVASLLTGVPPVFHQMMSGNVRMGWQQLKPLGLRLAEEGRLSVGVSQSFVVGPAFGFDQAFSHFTINSQLSGRELRTDSLRGILRHQLLRNDGFSKPLFAYLHTVGPHGPYTPTEEYMKWVEPFPGKFDEDEYLPGPFSINHHGSDPEELAHIKALYSAEVAYEDAAFARFIDFLKFLGVYDDSIIIFTSDHGEEFFDHGGFDHGKTLFEELTHVPLIIRFPDGQWAGREVQTRVSTMHIPATIGEILGLDWGFPVTSDLSISPRVLDAAGRKLSPPLFSEVHQSGVADDGAISYNAVWDQNTKCLFSQTKIDQFGQSEPYFRVYDLEDDPSEQHQEVVDDGSELACWSGLREWMHFWIDKRDQESPDASLSVDEKVRSQMKALGYLQ